MGDVFFHPSRFVDNAIMILAGDAVERSMMHLIPISTMAAAGFGNLMSDVCGVGLGGVIESFAAKLGVEPPPLTRAQQQLRVARFTVHAGSAVGISIGCIIGMFPLLLLNRDEEEIHMKEYHGGLHAHAAHQHTRHQCPHVVPTNGALEDTAQGTGHTPASTSASTATSSTPHHLLALCNAAAGMKPFLRAQSVTYYHLDSVCRHLSTLHLPIPGSAAPPLAMQCEDAPLLAASTLPPGASPVVKGARVLVPVRTSPAASAVGVLEVVAATTRDGVGAGDGAGDGAGVGVGVGHGSGSRSGSSVANKKQGAGVSRELVARAELAAHQLGSMAARLGSTSL